MEWREIFVGNSHSTSMVELSTHCEIRAQIIRLSICFKRSMETSDVGNVDLKLSWRQCVNQFRICRNSISIKIKITRLSKMFILIGGKIKKSRYFSSFYECYRVEVHTSKMLHLIVALATFRFRNERNFLHNVLQICLLKF